MYVLENEEYAEIKYFWLIIEIQLLCLVVVQNVSYVAVHFHVSYSSGA